MGARIGQRFFFSELSAVVLFYLILTQERARTLWVMGRTQGCDSRTRGNHARGLKNSLHAVFTRYLRGNHVRYIYGVVLKYTANTGESVFFLVVGGRRVFKFRVWCACLSLYSLFSLRALSSRLVLVRAPSAVVYIAMDHGCAHTDKCEMLLKISS